MSNELPEFDEPLVNNGWHNFGERYETFKADQLREQAELRKRLAEAAAGNIPEDADPNDPVVIATTTAEQRFAMAEAIAMAEAPKGKKS